MMEADPKETFEKSQMMMEEIQMMTKKAQMMSFFAIETLRKQFSV